MLLINVTEFFRDPPAWEHLRDAVLPELLAAKGRRRARARVERRLRERPGGVHAARWCFAELLGVDAFRERVKIYATDIDEDALNQARLAIYNAKETESVPPELRERYFERADQRLAFRKDLRRTVIFGRNNLVQDAPISRLDLLICRNTLMYFNAETQARILRHFHFALHDGGVLMLGKSEMMVSHRDLFAAGRPQEAHLRQAAADDRRLARGRVRATARARPGATTTASSRDAALELGPHAHADRLAHRPADVRQPARPRAVSDLARRPGASRSPSSRSRRTPVELVAPDRAGAARAPPRDRSARRRSRPSAATPRRLDVSVTPLLIADNVALGASMTFEDVTRYAALQTELEGNRRDLELAYEELQSTIDELETTNEELQSANEELQTTNEELQSTNEELETMNEELQSTNEELETINDELRERTGELNQVNDFLETILTSLGLRRRRARPAPARAGLEPARRGPLGPARRRGGRQPLPEPRHRAAVRAARARRCAPCSAAPSERETRELEAVNRRGRTIVCAATVLPLVGPRPGDGRACAGAIVLMENRRVDAADGRRDHEQAGARSQRAGRARRGAAAERAMRADEARWRADSADGSTTRGARARGGRAAARRARICRSCTPARVRAGRARERLARGRRPAAARSSATCCCGARAARPSLAQRRGLGLQDVEVRRWRLAPRARPPATSAARPAVRTARRRRSASARRVGISRRRWRTTSATARRPRARRSAATCRRRGARAALARQLGERGRDRRPARTDQLADQPVREHQRHRDAVARDAAPALGEMPEQRQQAAVDAVELRDRLRDREPLRALGRGGRRSPRRSPG